MTAVQIALLAALCTCLPVPSATGGEALTVRLTPTISAAPGFVVVRATVAHDPDTASNCTVRRLLPHTVTLLGSRGPRAAVSRSLMVIGGGR